MCSESTPKTVFGLTQLIQSKDMALLQPNKTSKIQLNFFNIFQRFAEERFYFMTHSKIF